MIITGTVQDGYQFNINIEFLTHGKVKVALEPVKLHYYEFWKSHEVKSEELVETIQKGLKHLRAKITM